MCFSLRFYTGYNGGKIEGNNSNKQSQVLANQGFFSDPPQLLNVAQKTILWRNAVVFSALQAFDCFRTLPAVTLLPIACFLFY
jgi:hypothetical protein